MIPTFENVDTNVVSKVFVLYTGGTIGMTRNTREARNKNIKVKFYYLLTSTNRYFFCKTIIYGPVVTFWCPPRTCWRRI